MLSTEKSQTVVAHHEGTAPLKNNAYEKELRRLEEELCHLHDWVKATGQRIVVVFEGRDAAGKGGMIKMVDRSRKDAYDDESPMINRLWIPEGY